MAVIGKIGPEGGALRLGERAARKRVKIGLARHQMTPQPKEAAASVA